MCLDNLKLLCLSTCCYGVHVYQVRTPSGRKNGYKIKDLWKKAQPCACLEVNQDIFFLKYRYLRKTYRGFRFTFTIDDIYCNNVLMYCFLALQQLIRPLFVYVLVSYCHRWVMVSLYWFQFKILDKSTSLSWFIDCRYGIHQVEFNLGQLFLSNGISWNSLQNASRILSNIKCGRLKIQSF